MDVRQLRYFVSVADNKTLTRASEVLHIAQPALSAQIRKLEDEVRTQLIVRHSRGIELTPAGQVLYDRALIILREVDETTKIVRDYAGPPRGTVRLGITPSTNSQLVAELLQRASVLMPNVQIVVKEGLGRELLELLRQQELDLALVHLTREDIEDCRVDVMSEEDAVFVMAARDESANNSTITLAEACEYPLVMPAPPHQLRSLLEASAQSEGLNANIVLEIESINTILEIAERGIAGCVLPRGAVERRFAEGRLHMQTIVEPHLPLVLALVSFPEGQTFSKAESGLQNMISELVKSHSH